MLHRVAYWTNSAAAFALLLFLVARLSAGDELEIPKLKAAQKLFLEQHSIEMDAWTLLDSVKDISQARAAQATLRDLKKRNAACSEAIEKLKLPRALEISLIRDLGQPGDPEPDKVYRKLSKVPGLLDQLASNYPIREHDEGNRSIAPIFVRHISNTVDLYHKRFKTFPSSLEELTTTRISFLGTTTFLDREMLIDPWGRPYQYDPAGPMNKGKCPDVWSKGPMHGDAKEQRIGNWPD